MSSPLEELEAAVMALPREQRARLAEHLLESLDEDDEIEWAWKQEVRDRLEAYRAGRVDTVDAEDVVDEARNAADR